MTDEVPDIVTPCCGAKLVIITPWVGSYSGGEGASEIVCSGYRCGNSWTPEGESDEYNRMPERKEEE